jgi:predicted TIM-barrel fold metal-dependent hydrolase
MSQHRFREGFACLARLGLSFDAWVFHPQLDELLDLVRAFPGTRIVINHLGGPLHIGSYAGRRDDIFRQWATSLRRLAEHPNVFVKLGGIGSHYGGFGLLTTSEALSAAWRPYIETCLEAFGPARCMFESNFPVDKRSCGYAVLWNAFKRMTSGASADEKADLFSRTASRFYRLGL